jgi:integrase
MASPHYDKRRGTWEVRLRWPRGREGRQRTIPFDNEKAAREGAENANRLLTALTNPQIPLNIPENVEDVPLWLVSGGAKGFKQASQASRPTTIRELVDAYLAVRKSQVGSGPDDISNDMYMDDYYQLEAFAEYCGKTSMSEVLTPDFLQRHKTAIRAKYAATSVWHSVKAVKRLLTWGWKHEKIDSLPRSLDDYATVARPKPTPTFFTVEEVKAMYEKATPRMRLYMLLALNGGFTQVDIATLTHSMIDWGTAVISRDRNKTQISQSCKLWPATLALLRQEATKRNVNGDNLVLLTERNNPLVAVGEKTKNDAVKCAFNRIKKKCKLERNRSFKTFRKTGANMIDKQFQSMPQIRKQYLAQSLDAIGKHYVQTHFDEMHKATDWLATQFGFHKAEPVAQDSPSAVQEKESGASSQ